MKTLATIFVSVVLSLTGAYILVSYVPLNFFPDVKQEFGSTITTILGSDTISASRSVINTNFANLNSDKAENTVATLASLTSAASLATIGTITSGTWNGGIIGATWGGTGSSTLSSNQVLLGNGTGVVKVPNGLGTSGQFLTSGGAGVAPTWTSSTLDTSLNFNWTGTNYFKNFNASSTTANPFSLNGLTFDTPSTRAASSSVLAEDGNGHLTWIQPPRILYNAAPFVSSSVNATTTLATAVIPANTLGVGKSLRISGSWQGANGCYGDIEYGNGSATTTIAASAQQTSAQANLNIGVTALTAMLYSTTTNQQWTTSISIGSKVINADASQSFGAFSSVTTSAVSYVGFAIKSGSSNLCTFVGGTVELLTQ